MSQNYNFKDEFKNQYLPFFSESLISEALSQFSFLPIQVSFIKESSNPENNEKMLIVSGIIKVQSGVDLRLTLKTKDKNPLSIKSNCSCIEHSKKQHCIHVLLLLLKVLTQHKVSEFENENGNDSNGEQKQINNDLIINSTLVQPPQIFGTLITNFQLNENNLTQKLQFQNLQYSLLNNKIVHFNNPKNLPLNFKIIINLKTEIITSNINEKIIANPFFGFEIEGRELKHISLFDLFYIFDFETGDIYHTPFELKDLISKVLKNNIKFSVDELFNYIILFLQKTNFEIFLNDMHVDLNNISECNDQHFTILSTPANKLIHLNYYIKKDENTFIVPFITNIFSLDEEIFSHFSKKLYAYNFIEKLFLNIHNNISTQSFGPELRHTKQKQIFELYLYFLSELKSDIVYSFHFASNTFYKHSLTSIINAFHKLYQFYGKAIFANGKISENRDVLTLKCVTKTFYESFPEFYESFENQKDIFFFIKKNQISKYNKSFGVTRNPSNIDWFDISVKLSAEDIDFLDKVKDNNQIYETNNEVLFLTKSQLHLIKFFKRNIDLKSQKKNSEDLSVINIKLKKHNIFELFSLHQEGILPALHEEELLFCQQISNLDELPAIDIPDIKEATLRNYQISGLKWMHFLYQNGLGHCLADDMGLGKTLQTITLIKAIEHQNPKILIICPVSILLIWKTEFEKFTSLNVQIYYGNDRKMEEEGSNSSILITSYGILKNELLTTFKDKNFDLIIFDEAQNFKNPKSKATFAAKTISGNVKITLTGTPLENDLSEFYNILDVSLPGIWNQYLKLKRKNDVDLIKISKKIASPFILRRTKSEVLKDLPPKNEQTLTLVFSEKEEEFYKKEFLKIKNKVINRTAPAHSGEVLNDILYLRKLCLWQKSSHIGELLSTKIDFLKDTILQINQEGHKAIIFSQFTEYLDLVEKEFKHLKIPFARFDGTYSLKKREREIKRFENDVPIILISLKAGGTGLNLNMASYVFLLDPWWNPAVEEQAIDRAYRLGKEFPLTVYKLVIKNTIEEKIINLQKRKKDLFNEILSDSENVSNFKFDLKELENILFS